MPAWLITALQVLPAVIALINEIIAAAQGNPTPAQMAQIAAYSAYVDGVNQALAYHVNV